MVDFPMNEQIVRIHLLLLQGMFLFHELFLIPLISSSWLFTRKMEQLNLEVKFNRILWVRRWKWFQVHFLSKDMQVICAKFKIQLWKTINQISSYLIWRWGWCWSHVQKRYWVTLKSIVNAEANRLSESWNESRLCSAYLSPKDFLPLYSERKRTEQFPRKVPVPFNGFLVPDCTLLNLCLPATVKLKTVMPFS